jgi:hypothetical protein
MARRLGTRAASYTGEAPDPYSGNTGFEALAAHAGVKATGRPRDFKTRGLRVRIAPSAPMPGRLMAGQLALDQLIEVRVLARQRRQYVSHALVAQQARARLSYRRGRPFDPGQGLDYARQSGRRGITSSSSRSARTPTGRETGPRCRTLRVRIPPSAQGARRPGRWIARVERRVACPPRLLGATG